MSETATTLALAEYIDGYLAKFCDHCWREKSTDADWESYDDGEGEHLCWEHDLTCTWIFDDLTRARRITEAIKQAPPQMLEELVRWDA